jgi:Fe(II)/alpha-ketoglutarate-dependent arginine beta-hydroxylase
MYRFVWTDEELDAVQTLLQECALQYKSVEDPEFIKYAGVLAHSLPKRLRWLLHDFKQSEPAPGVCLVSGYPVNNHKIKSTPSHWKKRQEVSTTLEEDLLFVLISSILGEVFGWFTEQDRCIVHEVVPIKEHEDKQISTSSEQYIWWHTEDAFHPYQGDYIGLMCLRNPDAVVTTYACIDMLKLDEAHIKTLFEPRFTIRPDVSHFDAESPEVESILSSEDQELASAYRKMKQMNSDPAKVAILFGSPKSAYMRIDPYFMNPLTDDHEAQQAFDALTRAIDSVLSDLILLPGDICFIDNYRTVHGRKPYKARYDGSDRWLKRINITRDLRKSRNARSSATSRIIF